jgi:hypothetical protein
MRALDPGQAVRMNSCASVSSHIRELERKLDNELDEGVSPDSFNVGWLEGGIFELRRLIAEPPGSLKCLEPHSGGWRCPDCEVWIDPTELGCGCCRRVSPR